jgi:pilus assembly protein CpaE
MDPKRALIIAAENAAARQFQQTLMDTFPLLSAPIAGPDGTAVHLAAMLDLQRPDVIFLNVEDMQKAIDVLAAMREIHSDVPVVTMSRWPAGPELLDLMRHGVRERLQLPVDAVTLIDSLRRLKAPASSASRPGAQMAPIVAFLPAKPGSGASTVAAHAAHACARALGNRVALLDLDINCGVQAFFAKRNVDLSIYDVCQYAGSLDDSLWSRMVVPVGNVDLVPSGLLRPGARIEVDNLKQVLAFAASKYACTFIDLSGNWERYSIAAMESASKIVQVTSPDFSALYHARRNLDVLREMGVIRQVHVVLNRATYHSGLDRKTVDTILGHPPAVSLPNAYHALQGALKEATVLAPHTPFGKGIEQLTKAILPAASHTKQGSASGTGLGRFLPFRLPWARPAESPARITLRLSAPSGD